MRYALITAGFALRKARTPNIVTGHGDFWTLVKQPFLKRDVPREVVNEVVRLVLEEAGWKYTRALTELGLPDDDYRKFMNFLAKFKLRVDLT